MAIDFGYDASGRGNNWTANNLSSTAGAGNDSLTDTPTSYGTDTGVGGEVRGNYCTLNPLENQGLTLSNGNLSAAYTPAAWQSAKATVSMTSGKWYFEATLLQTWSNGMLGVYPTSSALASDGLINNAYSYQTDGRIWSNKTVLTTTSSFSSGDTIMCAIDIDAGKLWFGRNGTWYNSGAPASGTNATYTGLSGAYSPATSIYSGSSGFAFNFGQRAFAYTAPSGFKALCTQNLPTPTIGATSTTQANRYFDVVLRNGFGSSGGSITSLNFQPDFWWEKARNNTYSHQWLDIIRGVGATGYSLSSNSTTAEVTQTNYLLSFNPNGYTLGTNDYSVATTLVDWCWKGGGTGVTNTAGTITSTVSANTTSGFSIVTYTGTGANATVGHGLGIKPGLMIFKSRNNAGSAADWMVYHSSLGATKNLRLQSTAAQDTQTAVFNDTEPTTTVFTVGTNNNINASTGTMVAYCFAPVAGYSAFGSYTGNGSTDGPFVYTGFRPRYVIVKNSTTAGTDWDMYDSSRSTYNQANAVLRADTSGAELSILPIDFLSNGFKIRDTGTDINVSSATIIYAAFAESPFKYALAR